MSKQREELVSALEALQNEMRETISKLDPNEMVTVMPPSKPIGSVIGWYGGYPMIELFSGGWIPAVGTVLYAAPPARKPLTEPELNAIEPTWPNEWNYDDVLAFVRAIEQAHGITQPTEENT